jgi:hypothetical protein
VRVITLAGTVMVVFIGEKHLLPRPAPPDIAPPVQSAASTAGPLTAGDLSLSSLPRQRRADMAGDSSAQPLEPSSWADGQLLQPISAQSSSASSASTSVRQRCAS